MIDDEGDIECVTNLFKNQNPTICQLNLYIDSSPKAVGGRTDGSSKPRRFSEDFGHERSREWFCITSAARGNEC